ncbi:unnamed protein product, partial [Amoebophrya sp. A120]
HSSKDGDKDAAVDADEFTDEQPSAAAGGSRQVEVGIEGPQELGMESLSTFIQHDDAEAGSPAEGPEYRDEVARFKTDNEHRAAAAAASGGADMKDGSAKIGQQSPSPAQHNGHHKHDSAMEEGQRTGAYASLEHLPDYRTMDFAPELARGLEAKRTEDERVEGCISYIY